MRARISGALNRPMWPDHGRRPSGRIMPISRRRAAGDLDHAHAPAGRPARHRRRAACDARRWRRGRRAAPPGASVPSRARPSASWSPRLVPASACTSSITTAASVREHRRRVGQREQQREAFGRGEQQVRRRLALAAAFVAARVAGAGVDAERQRQLVDRPGQVARDVGGQRLQRADIERVQARARAQRRGRSGWAGTPPASCRRRSARSAGRSRRPARLSSTASWCARGVHPWRANQPAKGSGNVPIAR